MLIETWLLAVFFLLVAGIAFISLIGWVLESARHDECRKENESLKKDLKNHKEVINTINGRLIVQDATDFYKEGKKK